MPFDWRIDAVIAAVISLGLQPCVESLLRAAQIGPICAPSKRADGAPAPSSAACHACVIKARGDDDEDDQLTG